MRQEVRNGAPSRTEHDELVLEGTPLAVWQNPRPDADCGFLIVTLPGRGPEGFSVLSGLIVSQ